MDPTLIAPYQTMAQTYVLADNMFPTEWGGSFTGHLMLIAGTDNISQTPSQAEVDFPDAAPDDCDSPAGTKSSFLNAKRVEHFYKGPFPCFDQFNTIAQLLDGASPPVSWKIYATKVLNAGLWEPFEAIKSVRYGQDWNTDIIAPQTQVLTDAGDGQLASVSWVTPSKQDSDHPGNGDGGPSWVASVVNAIGESSYWDSTAIIVLWDDWGGWYDNASPPQLDYRGLGFRVPCLIISPYARETSSSQPGYVSHTQYEYASTLRFIEEVFGLGNIGPASEGYTDVRANSLDDSFDFTQQPRAFTAIPSKYSKAHFLHERPSNEPVDTQ
jgi:phospholipase C